MFYGKVASRRGASAIGAGLSADPGEFQRFEGTWKVDLWMKSVRVKSAQEQTVVHQFLDEKVQETARR